MDAAGRPCGDSFAATAFREALEADGSTRRAVELTLRIGAAVAGAALTGGAATVVGAAHAVAEQTADTVARSSRIRMAERGGALGLASEGLAEGLRREGVVGWGAAAIALGVGTSTEGLESATATFVHGEALRALGPLVRDATIDDWREAPRHREGAPSTSRPEMGGGQEVRRAEDPFDGAAPLPGHLRI